MAEGRSDDGEDEERSERQSRPSGYWYSRGFRMNFPEAAALFTSRERSSSSLDHLSDSSSTYVFTGLYFE